MKITLGATQSVVNISFDYPNMVQNNNIPFIWFYNTNTFNEENRLWSFSGTDLFYILAISQYTHKQFMFPGSVVFTNNRYTEGNFQIYQGDPFALWNSNTNFWELETETWNNVGINTFFNTQDEGFYYIYYCLEDLSGDVAVLYEDLAYIQVQGKRTTFTPAISTNETREIIFAD